MLGSLFTGILPAVQDDGDLDYMLTDMKEVFFSWMTTHPNGGWKKAQSTTTSHRERFSGQTHVTWSGPRQEGSMSGSSVLEYIYGQPSTVMSDGAGFATHVPWSVSIWSNRSVMAKKYKLVHHSQTQ